MVVNKISFDIDVALIKVWKEKRDKRRKEAEEFFKFLDKHKNRFSVMVAKRVFDLIERWKHKILVERVKSIYKKQAKKIIRGEPLVEKFASKFNLNSNEFINRFSKKARIKYEDAGMLIVYSLTGVEYFITFNRKHLRNKYEEIKTVGWKFGLKTPDIMLPKEFVTFFSRSL